MAKAKKKQKFFDVDMPILNKETQLYGYAIEDFHGKSIKYDLTRFLRGKNMILKLKVQVKDEKASSYPIELNLLAPYLRRMVRKGTNYVEDSFSIETKNARVKIKPFLITRKKVSHVVQKALREKAHEELTKDLEGKTTQTIFEELLQNKIQKSLSLILKKIYPLSLCEIRSFKIEEEFPEKKEDKKETKKESVKVEEKETEEKPVEVKEKKTEKSEKPKVEKEKKVKTEKKIEKDKE